MTYRLRPSAVVCTATFSDLDAPKGVPSNASRKLVVVSRNKRCDSLFRFCLPAFVNDVVMQLRPKPATARLPAIHDIPTKYRECKVRWLLKLQQRCCLTAWRSRCKSEMTRPDIGSRFALLNSSGSWCSRNAMRIPATLQNPRAHVGTQKCFAIPGCRSPKRMSMGKSAVR